MTEPPLGSSRRPKVSISDAWRWTITPVTSTKGDTGAPVGAPVSGSAARPLLDEDGRTVVADIAAALVLVPVVHHEVDAEDVVRPGPTALGSV